MTTNICIISGIIHESLQYLIYCFSGFRMFKNVHIGGSKRGQDPKGSSMDRKTFLVHRTSLQFAKYDGHIRTWNISRCNACLKYPYSFLKEYYVFFIQKWYIWCVDVRNKTVQIPGCVQLLISCEYPMNEQIRATWKDIGIGKLY